MSRMEETPFKAGQKVSWSRTITDAEILSFAELSGDKGAHHLERDAQGRLMAHGLLTSTLPTKLGGDMNYMARTMNFEFLKPVYGGDTLTCGAVVQSIVAQSTRFKMKLAFEIVNQKGEAVLKGTSAGQILRKS